MKKFILIFGLMVSFGLLTSCATKTEEKKPETAEELYNTGYDELEKTAYTKAGITFEKIELEHPYSKWATKAKLMSAYAYYKEQKYDDAILSIDRFIKFNPGNKDISYAYYMKALCYYDQVVGVEKDQGNSEQALQAFNEVIIRFPDTKYATDAKLKTDLIFDHLAGQEMEIGRFYLNQYNYLSALNRFSVVVNHYQTTSHIEEALYRQVEIYKLLGLNPEAEDSMKVLGYNYPNSKWYKDALSVEKQGK